MNKGLRQRVVQRAGGRCEYCLISPNLYPLTFEVEHVVPLSHGGGSRENNLALACIRCNRQKGTNLAGMDPQTGALVRLFNPREDLWQEHLKIDAEQIVGVTDVGRATVEVLRMNDDERLKLRRWAIRRRKWPPKDLS